jgi:hypothetical protein
VGWTDILEVFENPYDLPQLVICTHPVGQIFNIFYAVLNREICERCIGKDAVLRSYPSTFLEQLRNMPKKLSV